MVRFDEELLKILLILIKFLLIFAKCEMVYKWYINIKYMKMLKSI